MVTGPIQLQRIEIELGNDFPEFWARTESYVKGLIGKPWWANKKQLLSCEGPLGKMVEHCLLYIIEKNDRIEGYKAYTHYLTSEYGSSLSRIRKTTNLGALNYATVQAGDQVLLGTQSPSEEKVSEEIPEWLTAEQTDFLFMHYKMGMAQTAKAAGMTEKQAWQHYRTIKARLRYNG